VSEIEQDFIQIKELIKNDLKIAK